MYLTVVIVIYHITVIYTLKIYQKHQFYAIKQKTSMVSCSKFITLVFKLKALAIGNRSDLDGDI